MSFQQNRKKKIINALIQAWKRQCHQNCVGAMTTPTDKMTEHAKPYNNQR